MSLGLTKPRTEMSTRNNSWDKGGQYLGLTTYRLHVPIGLKSGSLNLLEHYGHVPVYNGITLPYLALPVHQIQVS
jgi:hypothetical protein